MFGYRVRLNHSLATAAPPPLLRAFGWWLGNHPRDALGRFELEWFAIPRSRTPGAHRFAALARERNLVLSAPNKTGEVWIESRTRRRIIAASLAEFLLLLATANTGVIDLDHSVESSRLELLAWLRQRRALPRRKIAVSAGYGQ